EIRSALVVGRGEHQEQWRGIYTAVIAVEWDFAQPRHLALAHFVQYLAWFGVAFRIAAGRLRVRAERQNSAGDLRGWANNLQRGDNVVPAEDGAEPRNSGVRIETQPGRDQEHL